MGKTIQEFRMSAMFGYCCECGFHYEFVLRGAFVRTITCCRRLEMLFFAPGACIGASPNCIGINMGGFPFWLQATMIMFPSRTVHNLFTPNCVGWGGGNHGPEQNGKPITNEDSAGVLLP